MNKPREIVVTLKPETSEDDVHNILIAISMLQHVGEVLLKTAKK